MEVEGFESGRCWVLWNLVVFDPDYNPTRNNIAIIFNRRYSTA